MDEKVNMAIKGDVQAFSSLIDSIKDNLYRTAYAYVKCKEDALDIVGDTIYKAFISIDKLRNPKLFKTWITRILINNAITFNKKRGRVIYLEEEALGNMEAMKEDSDEKLDLLCAIDKLDERYKEVIILKYFDDLTINEISKVLDKPEGTIKTYLNEGMMYYPKDQMTDHPERFVMAEFIREKILYFTREEVPHSVAIVVERMAELEDGSVEVIATIVVDRKSQKGILIGKQGSMIKKIRQNAQREMKRFLQTTVHLELFVKVENNWRNKQKYLKEFGYNEDDY